MALQIPLRVLSERRQLELSRGIRAWPAHVKFVLRQNTSDCLCGGINHESISASAGAGSQNLHVLCVLVERCKQTPVLCLTKEM